MNDEIISTGILSRPLIQDAGQLSVSGISIPLDLKTNIKKTKNTHTHTQKKQMK